MLNAVLPLKDLTTAKSRLCGVLSNEQREHLAIAMALDLIDTLWRHTEIANLTVIAGERWESHLPRRSALRVLFERDIDATGLNAVLEQVIDTELKDAHQTRKGEHWLLLHGDLPLFCGADIDAVQKQLGIQPLVLCPDDASRGTNALAFQKGARLPLRFGEDSFSKHRQAAKALQQRWGEVCTPGLGLDVDTQSDLQALARAVAAGANPGHRVGAWLAAQRDVIPMSEGPMSSQQTQLFLAAKVVARP